MRAERGSTPGTVSPLRRASAYSELQVIAADYYNITDVKGAPLAGLLVLMDRQKRPVRAELHLNENTVGPLQELARRQAHLLLTDRYHGDTPVRLYTLRVQLEHESTSVPLEAPPPPSGVPAWVRPLALTLAAVVVFGGLGWLLNDAFTGKAAPTAALETPAPAVSQSVAAPPVAPDAGTAGENPEQPQNTADAERIFETNGLPASRNAIPMDVGQRARLAPGYSITLRSEPGAEAGAIVGYLQDAVEMTLINGPIWLQGNSDTIVWWFVRLDDGSEGWVPANTSELTLLEPVE